MAGRTGIEPATSGVTGRRSNQLNYHPRELLKNSAIEEIRIISPFRFFVTKMKW